MDSVIGWRTGGFWYAEAELMKTYCPVRPVNRSTSPCTCSGVKATKSTTASNSWLPSAVRAEEASRMSPCRTCASRGSGRVAVWPRLSTYRSMPRSTARRAHAELMTPVPPMNSTFREVTRSLLVSSSASVVLRRLSAETNLDPVDSGVPSSVPAGPDGTSGMCPQARLRGCLIAHFPLPAGGSVPVSPNGLTEPV